MNHHETYLKMDFDYDSFQLTRIFSHELLDEYPEHGVQDSKAKEIYGELRFPTPPPNRPYTCGSLVQSIDGKIAYIDNPAGPVIASANKLDPEGGATDFWLLNHFRASMDVVIAGAGTMHKEPDGTVCVMDQNLEDERIARGMSRIPWVVICSLDGSDIRYEDALLINQPAIIHSSPAAEPIIAGNLPYPSFVIGPYTDAKAALADADNIRTLFDTKSPQNIPVILTGVGSRPDEEAMLTILHILGLRRALVESPSYCIALMGKGLLDEFLLDMSCVFVGGDAMSMGKSIPAFTSTNHPHSKVLSIHMHSPSFFYFRHKMVY